MKKLLLLCVFSLGMATMSYGQGTNGGMTDAQVLQYVMQEKQKGTAESEIAQQLLQKGATLEQIQKIREK